MNGMKVMYVAARHDKKVVLDSCAHLSSLEKGVDCPYYIVFACCLHTALAVRGNAVRERCVESELEPP